MATVNPQRTSLPSLSQFQGCLIGGLVGDSLGYPFENEADIHRPSRTIQNYFDGLLSAKDIEFKQYTDDTAMTMSVAREIIERAQQSPKIDPKSLAKRFTTTYYDDKTYRCYGTHVPRVFSILRSSDYADPFKPSQDQFGGSGSFGNGSGMRVSPISLCSSSLENLVEEAVLVSRITHAHPLGIVGGIFQSLAIKKALEFGGQLHQAGETSPAPSHLQILEAFKADFDSIKTNSSFQPYFQSNHNIYSAMEEYSGKVEKIEQFLREQQTEDEFDIDVGRVKREIGVKVTAVNSVPTGLFCFLMSFKPISFIKTENQFQRTIQLAISLGGDTDTIAAMAGNIAGAYLGIEEIPKELLRHCEGSETMMELANKLFESRQGQGPSIIHANRV